MSALVTTSGQILAVRRELDTADYRGVVKIVQELDVEVGLDARVIANDPVSSIFVFIIKFVGPALGQFDSLSASLSTFPQSLTHTVFGSDCRSSAHHP